MRRILLFLTICLCAPGLFAQVSAVEVEVYADHDVDNPDLTELAGLTTYRIYAVLDGANDFLSAVYGLPDEPLEVSTTTTFYQNSFGGLRGEQLNPAVYQFEPALEYDSFIAIGRADQDDPGVSITGQEAPTEPWIGPFETDGGSFTIGPPVFGGAWFLTFSAEAVNALPDGDGRILVAQLTTDGVVTGLLNFQVFLDSDQENEERYAGFAFSSNPGAIFGCLDEDATNYNENANTDDGSCIFPCALVVDGLSITPTSCPGGGDGAVSIDASGQQGGIFYSLDGGNQSASNNFNNVSSGEHEILISDSQGCTLLEEFVIGEPEDIVVMTSLSSPITCNGETDAVIEITASGGTGPLQFDLDENFTNPTTDLMFSDLAAGNYTVYAIDDNGCEQNSIAINITEPLVLQASITATADANCFGEASGVISGFAFGGSAPYQYSVDNGTTYQNTNVFDIAAGMYELLILDANGCTVVVDEMAVIGEPDALVLTPTADGVACFGDTNGQVSVAAQGGTPGYVYSFNGGDFSADETLWIDLAGGDYNVQVMDSNDCLTETIATITEPEELTVDVTSEDILCNGDDNGEVTAVAAGGTEDYTYSLDGGDAVSNSTFDDLGEGTYEITVIDANGCETSGSADVVEPEELVISDVTIVNEDEGEGNGSVDITVEGGTGDLTYDWVGDGFTADTEDLDDLPVGDYQVTITDENDCSVTETFQVLV
ncbi:MAG: hypothetical protein AAF193_04120, partial [Bacteroidota bacterium]